MRSRSAKQAAVWGGLLVILGVMALIATFVDISAWVWVVVLALVGLGVFAVYLTDRSDLALLIPAYVLWAIAILITLVTLGVLRDELVAGYVLLAIALPFLGVFLRDRQQKWALLPAYILLAIALMIVLIGAGILQDRVVASYVLFAVAIPFLFVFARDARQWWALIPGGIIAIVGLALLVSETSAQYIAPVILIIAGIVVLVRAFIRKEPAPSDEPASPGPQDGNSA